MFRPLNQAHPTDQSWPGLLLLRIEGRLFFTNAQGVAMALRRLIEQAQPRVVVLDCSAVIDIEYSALRMLINLDQHLARHGIRLWLAALNPTVLEVVKRSELGERLGSERLLSNVERAVERFEGQAGLGAMASAPL